MNGVDQAYPSDASHFKASNPGKWGGAVGRICLTGPARDQAPLALCLPWEGALERSLSPSSGGILAEDDENEPGCDGRIPGLNLSAGLQQTSLGQNSRAGAESAAYGRPWFAFFLQRWGGGLRWLEKQHKQPVPLCQDPPPGFLASLLMSLGGTCEAEPEAGSGSQQDKLPCV